MKKTISWYKIKIPVPINVVLSRISLLDLWGWLSLHSMDRVEELSQTSVAFPWLHTEHWREQDWVIYIPTSAGPRVCHICSSITQTNPTSQREEENRNFKFAICRPFPSCVLTVENNRFHSDTSRYGYNVGFFFYHIQPVIVHFKTQQLMPRGSHDGEKTLSTTERLHRSTRRKIKLPPKLFLSGSLVSKGHLLIKSSKTAGVKKWYPGRAQRTTLRW